MSGFDYLQELVKFKMPFGKYKGWLLSDLPEPYLVWFHRELNSAVFIF